MKKCLSLVVLIMSFAPAFAGKADLFIGGVHLGMAFSDLGHTIPKEDHPERERDEAAVMKASMLAAGLAIGTGTALSHKVIDACLAPSKNSSTLRKATRLLWNNFLTRGVMLFGVRTIAYTVSDKIVRAFGHEQTSPRRVGNALLVHIVPFQQGFLATPRINERYARAMDNGQEDIKKGINAGWFITSGICN